jgi:mRNA-degrading endonuclease RelE of RelBE toxin-antitoxin system
MYEIRIEESAENFLKKLQIQDRDLILKKIYSIRDNPFRFLKRLQGDKLWRLRIANFRAICDVVVSNNKIIVLRIGKRENVYD